MPTGVYKHKIHSKETKKKMSESGKGKKHIIRNKGNMGKNPNSRKGSVFIKGHQIRRLKPYLSDGHKKILEEKVWGKRRGKTYEDLMGKEKAKKLKENLSESHRWQLKEKNPAWKGGITPMNKIIRKSREYKLWRQAVFERDDYTCIWCGKKFIKGVTGRVMIHADHIKPFALFPELRFAIDNGRTLCIDCHRKTDTYGGRNHK